MFLRFNKFTILWAVTILVLALVPSPSNSNISLEHTDKIVHFVLFSVLTLLMIVGFSKQETYTTLKYNAIKISLITSLGYGLLIEMMQFLLVYRNFSMVDMVANAVGVGFGYGMFQVIYKMNLK